MYDKGGKGRQARSVSSLIWSSDVHLKKEIAAEECYVLPTPEGKMVTGNFWLRDASK